MKSHVTAKSRKCFSALPGPVREQARTSYRLFLDNPNHPSLRLKQVHPSEPIVSVRIGIGRLRVTTTTKDDEHGDIVEKTTYRLGQRPGSCVILEYVRARKECSI